MVTTEKRYFFLRKEQDDLQKLCDIKMKEARAEFEKEWKVWGEQDSEGMPHGASWDKYRELDVIRDKLMRITEEVKSAYCDALISYS